MDTGKLIEMTLTIIIQVLLPVALVVAVKWINSKVVESKAVIRNHNLEFAVTLVQQLVAAAEQNGLTGALKKAGAEKKSYVIAQATAELARHGINMDLETLDALIEAEVNHAFGKIDVDFSDVAGPAPTV